MFYNENMWPYSNRNIVIFSDGQLSELGRQSLQAELEDNQYKQLRLLLRLSVCEGVHSMYTKYSEHKWNQVQSTAESIKSQIEADTSESTTSSTTSPTGGSPKQDKSAAQWASVDISMYRTE